MKPLVLVLMGSPSDWEIMRHTVAELDALGIPSRAHVASAHRTPERVRTLVRDAEADGVRVFVCGAGMAAHLAGVVASLTVRPVIGVPLPGGLQGGMDALLATVQMPGGIPVATVAVGKAGARNAAMLAAEMIALGDPAVEAAVRSARAAQAEAVEKADATLGGERSDA